MRRCRQEVDCLRQTEGALRALDDRRVCACLIAVYGSRMIILRVQAILCLGQHLVGLIVDNNIVEGIVDGAFLHSLLQNALLLRLNIASRHFRLLRLIPWLIKDLQYIVLFACRAQLELALWLHVDSE